MKFIMDSKEKLRKDNDETKGLSISDNALEFINQPTSVRDNGTLSPSPPKVVMEYYSP